MNSGFTTAIMSNYDNGAMIVQQKFNELLFNTNKTGRSEKIKHENK
jgi:hypothetical protein